MEAKLQTGGGGNPESPNMSGECGQQARHISSKLSLRYRLRDIFRSASLSPYFEGEKREPRVSVSFSLYCAPSAIRCTSVCPVDPHHVLWGVLRHEHLQSVLHIPYIECEKTKTSKTHTLRFSFVVCTVFTNHSCEKTNLTMIKMSRISDFFPDLS